ncbi:MAG: hypothetical protein WC380_12770, partial [Pedobacter sp.]
MNKKFFLLAICLLPVLLFSVTRYVPAQYATIQLAINASSNGDIILVSSGTYGPISLGNKGLTIQGIQFSNVIIDGNETQRCVTLSQYSASPTYLRNMTITDGYAYSKGGGIYSPNERELNIEQCVIQNCTVLYDVNYGGGGIYCNGALELTECEINNCSTSAGSGGGIYMNSGSLSIESTEITYCESYLAGGGIFLIGSSTIGMVDCLVDHCTSGSGGGIMVQTYCDDIGDCKIYDTDFSYNSASYGGAVSLSQCSTDIRNSKFNNNTSVDGSALLLSSQLNPPLLNILIYISGSLFSSNVSDYSTIKISFAESNYLDQFKMNNSTLCNNDGGAYPGITFYTTIPSDASISHSIIRDLSISTYCDYDYCCLW